MASELVITVRVPRWRGRAARLLFAMTLPWFLLIARRDPVRARLGVALMIDRLAGFIVRGCKYNI